VKRQIDKRPRARIDLAEIYCRIGEDNLAAAERFAEAAEQDFQRLVEMPGMGRSGDLRSEI
jgi:plasmid stabilization system protein ParE